MAHLARIKLPSPIRLTASSRLAKSALLVLSLLVLAPLAAHAQGSPFAEILRRTFGDRTGGSTLFAFFFSL
jgi:hypothetical protein